MKLISKIKCDWCDGTGRSLGGKCSLCNGTGEEIIDHAKRILMMLGVCGSWGLIIGVGVAANGDSHTALIAGVGCFAMIAVPWSVWIVGSFLMLNMPRQTQANIWKVVVALSLVVLLGVGSQYKQEREAREKAQKEARERAELDNFTAPAPPQASVESGDSKTTATFTRLSNGRDWKRADSQSKERFCQTIAAAMTKEFKRDFSASFYSDALDAFYNTSDPNILNQNIHQIIGLITSSAMNQ